jgi:hypothetical protein
MGKIQSRPHDLKLSNGVEYCLCLRPGQKQQFFASLLREPDNPCLVANNNTPVICWVAARTRVQPSPAGTTRPPLASLRKAEWTKDAEYPVCSTSADSVTTPDAGIDGLLDSDQGVRVQ